MLEIFVNPLKIIMSIHACISSIVCLETLTTDDNASQLTLVLNPHDDGNHATAKLFLLQVIAAGVIASACGLKGYQRKQEGFHVMCVTS